MKLYQFVLLLPLLLSSVWAQPTRNPQAPASQVLSEQRRVELRQTLKAQGAPELPRQTQRAVTPASNRHLSEQERADLRQQLRQQRGSVPSERP
jgi:uncharacterized protein (DUF2267 family)